MLTNSSKTNNTNKINFDFQPCVKSSKQLLVLNDNVVDEVGFTTFLDIHVEQASTWDVHIEANWSLISTDTFALRKLSKLYILVSPNERIL